MEEALLWSGPEQGTDDLGHLRTIKSERSAAVCGSFNRITTKNTKPGMTNWTRFLKSVNQSTLILAAY